MQKTVTPRVTDTNTDRALKALDAAVSRLIQSPMANGVMVRGFKPGVDGPLRVPHGMGRRANGALIASSDRGVFRATVLKSDRESVTLGVASEWEILSRYDVKATITTFDFDAALNGDLDYEYAIDGIWKNPAGSTNTLRMRVNGVTQSANAGSSRYGGVAVTAATSTHLGLTRKLIASAEEVNFRATFIAETGSYRLLRSQSSHTSGTGSTATEGLTMATKWHDTTTKIAGLGIRSQLSGYLLAGSHFTLYRRPRLAGRTLNIWIF